MSICVPVWAPMWSRAWLAGLVALLLCLAGPAARAQDFLPVDEAFRLSVFVETSQRVRADIRVADGIYLYREQMRAELTAPGAAPQPVTWALPPGEDKYDPTFDKVMVVYHHDVGGLLPLPSPPPEGATLTVHFQGCADAGLCYPPQQRRFQLVVDAQGAVVDVLPDAGASEMGPAAAAPDDDPVSRALASRSLWVVVPAFLLAGLLLSLTPCVLPMVPILSSIIVGQRERVSRARGFALALSYAQGMALVYTALGIAAGMLGQGLAVYLQHPWVVLTVAALMVGLALSMFGLYELRLPASWQGALGAGANRLPGGRFISVMAMGAVSALVVSPCVSAPLAGALLYISQSRDVVLGGVALYALACGMSVPLLLVGLSAGSLLPRTGPWMRVVKAVFGVLMLGMAVWISRPAWPHVQTEWLGMAAEETAHRSVLPFRPIRSEAELNAALQRAAAAGQPVMLDFYADWCVSCIEMEQRTFADSQVRARLTGAILLQVDVTRHTAQDRALLKRFELFGPPAIVFVDPSGQELRALRVVGFMAPTPFLQRLDQAGI